MAGAAAAAVASGISARPAAPRRFPTGRRARPSVVQAAISVEKGEKAYTVQKSEQIFNAAKGVTWMTISSTASLCPPLPDAGMEMDGPNTGTEMVVDCAAEAAAGTTGHGD